MDLSRAFVIVMAWFVFAASISLLMAFPVMWCWNYAIVAVFGLPKITWGMAWCLLFLAQNFFKSTVTQSKS